jgi:taurine dioxygenase
MMIANAMQAATLELTTRPLKPGFGVEVLDFDFPTASQAQLLAFDRLQRSQPVVVLRDQKLTAAQVMALSQRMGKVSAQHRVGPHSEFPAITILSNKKVDGRLIGAHEVGRNWHTDGTTYAVLGLTTMLYGIECPLEGGDTVIADMCAAFASLPPERQKELEKIRVVHNRAHLIQKYNRAVLTPEEIEKMKDVIHPAVVISPVDGRKALFVTSGSTKRVIGMSEDEGMALVKELIAYATQEQFVYRHKWRNNDCLIWNDLCTMHTATPYDETQYDRLVYRTWMRPFEVVDSTTRHEEMMAHH